MYLPALLGNYDRKRQTNPTNGLEGCVGSYISNNIFAGDFLEIGEAWAEVHHNQPLKEDDIQQTR